VEHLEIKKDLVFDGPSEPFKFKQIYNPIFYA